MSPLKLFEYMAAGKPILCSDLPVLREIVEDGRNGLLLPLADADAWVAALCRLRDAPEERRRLGAAARADLVARYTWRERARRIQEFFAGGPREETAREFIEGGAGLELLRSIANGDTHDTGQESARRVSVEKL
jgi:hypothetical protein